MADDRIAHFRRLARVMVGVAVVMAGFAAAMLQGGHVATGFKVLAVLPFACAMAVAGLLNPRILMAIQEYDSHPDPHEKRIAVASMALAFGCALGVIGIYLTVF